ncbi:MAG: Lrp/AsnC family transcriptional regulator [Propionibacteriaceae bacterium]
MESIDRQILRLLAKDGRISYTEIGRETGLSTSAAQQRVRRLEQRGIITGYRAEINPEALGKMLTAFISLKPGDPTEPMPIVAILTAMPEVISCYSVAGDASFLIKVEVENPLALESLLAQIRTKAGCGTHTTLVLSVPFKDRITV